MGRIADPTESFAGISQVPEIAQHVGSATNNLQSTPDEIKTPDQRLVKGRITDATQSFAGISQVPEIAQNVGSAINNLQSAPDAINAIDAFSAILTPLKVFNTIADTIADVLVFIALYHRCD